MNSTTLTEGERGLRPAGKRDSSPAMPQAHWVGRSGNARWDPPALVEACGEHARPGYDHTTLAHEFAETDVVLREKVVALAAIVRRSRNTLLYTGAGLSTSSGVPDYATRAAGSVKKMPHLSSPLLARPTPAHHALVAMYRGGHVTRWVQQNHDGLPQKAGLPQHAINEIHGAWYDPSNPVVKMNGDLRSDLFAQMCDWENEAELCLALGTSMAGMNADRCATTPAAKHGRGEGLGLVIIGRQRTQHDGDCALRIFADLDKTLGLLAAELGCSVAAAGGGGDAAAARRSDGETRRYRVPYGPDGRRVPTAGSTLDLSDDATVIITAGQFKGDAAEVAGTDSEGNLNLRCRTKVKGSFYATVPLKLGRWWVDAAVAGAVPMIPVVSAAEAE